MKGGQIMMKNVLCILLAAVFIASALASCSAEPTAAISASIRLTTSDAFDAAAWLTDRLGDKLTDKLVLGTDADGYGVDVSALEADGYVIRSLGGEVALFARTTDGLDRAVRKYAHTVESGAPVADVTFHEGYRVKSLTIAGNDVSEYAIVRVTEDDPCVKTAAETLAKYIEKACGAALPVCTEADFTSTGRAHRIAISSGDASLGDEGFTISIGEDGTLTVSGGVWRGSLFGVYDLLEDIGWRFVGAAWIPTDRQEYLYEAEHVELDSSLNRTELPSIPIRGGFSSLKQKNTYSTHLNAKYGGYGFSIRSCHGLQNNNDAIFSGEYEGVYDRDADGHQPCFTNEEILEAIDSYALRSVKKRIDAGQQIGREIIDVDVAQWDSTPYCECKNCRAVFKEEGCHTGALLRMVNRVAALLDENYQGVYASFLVYTEASQLPKITRPAHNVLCAFCFYCGGYFSCSNHCISGDECASSLAGAVTNKIPAKIFEEWLEVTKPENIQVWYYPLNCFNLCYNSPIYTNLLNDMKYLADKKAGHVYLCTGSYNNGLINEELARYLCSKFAWDASVTKEESLDIMRDWFKVVYGDAGDLLYELTIFAEQAADRAGCWCSFFRGDRVDFDFIAEHSGLILSACEKAIGMADDKASEEAIEKYVTGFRFMALVSRYEDMYINGTDAERAIITGEYRTVWEAFRKYNFYIFNSMPHGGYAPETFDPDVDPHTWMDNSVNEG